MKAMPFSMLRNFHSADRTNLDLRIHGLWEDASLSLDVTSHTSNSIFALSSEDGNYQIKSNLLVSTEESSNIDIHLDTTTCNKYPQFII